MPVKIRNERKVLFFIVHKLASSRRSVIE